MKRRRCDRNGSGAPALDGTGGAVFLDQLAARFGAGREDLIPTLQAIQQRYRYLPAPLLRALPGRFGCSAADVAGVVSFYTQFRVRPVGDHRVTVCTGTACHVKRAPEVLAAIRRHLGLAADADTDAANEFTVEEVGCMGCCTLAPVIRVDRRTYGHLAPGRVAQTLAHHRAHHAADGVESVEPAPPPPATAAAGDRAEIRVGLGSCCMAGGSAEVFAELRRLVAGAPRPVALKRVGCVGMCHRTPFVEIVRPGADAVVYGRVRGEDVPAIFTRHFPPANFWGRLRRGLTAAADRWLYGDPEMSPAPGAAPVEPRDPPVAAFLGPQRHIATEQCGQLDPLCIREYRAAGGFQALRRAYVELAPAAIIATLTASGLRGRGGAGFPTGRKWAATRDAPGTEKFVVCNGDEGDPGAFMDRMILESYPFRVLEGMAVAARAVGAAEGLLYIRDEYPLAVERVEAAIVAMGREGLLGDNILGSGQALRLRVARGAGAFVCGEESAMLAALAGERGTPRRRPPYPAESGVRGYPTLINNVETFAVVPWILRHGPAAFAAIGTATSKGTKVFALAGKVARGGLIEVPMGVTIRQIVEEIGGGTASGRPFKAVQIGGPSGGCIPAAMADTPVDFDRLLELGAMMGSGGLVVLDDTDCMVDVARFFMGFIAGQSCGKCTSCRLGSRRMLDLLERLCAGRGHPDDLAELERLAEYTRGASLCGLGRTAPNPVLTTLRYFRHEYEAHLAGRCPAGRCPALIRYEITADCIGCTRCAQECPSGAIPLTPYRQHRVLSDLCIHCDACRQTCPAGAVVVRSREEPPCPA